MSTSFHILVTFYFVVDISQFYDMNTETATHQYMWRYLLSNVRYVAEPLSTATRLICSMSEFSDVQLTKFHREEFLLGNYQFLS
jgi:hypothetical protein